MSKKKKHSSTVAQQESSAENSGQVKKELEEQKNKLLRTLADFDNYKKRAAADRQEFAKFANQTLITDLLPVLDGFERAISAANAHKDICEGLGLIKRQLEGVFNKYGVKEVEALGKPYDANFHQAMAQQEDDGPEGIVIQEMQKGYTLHGRLIRPAMVIVSKKSEASSSKS